MIIDRDLGIPLSDGTRLSAKIWRPETSDTEPVPAILEYLPYRKSDGTAARDETMHPWFAAQGYACLRVDRRGCGDSDGLFDDEYSEQELRDGEEVLEWISTQPWCTGRVGMQGISWGGFNGVQLAARAPEPLKAVISIGTTVDRYHDDIHYKGGIQLCENIGWAATATSWSSMPPDPNIVGQKWRDMWLERLRNMPFLARRWTEQSNRSAYWKHGSICETYGSLKAPVLVLGGLHDGYRNAMAAMVENLKCPVQGITGPWSHKYPHISTVAPSIDYHNLALRWWDHWLKDVENSAENDSSMRTYVMDSVLPDPNLKQRPGNWVALSSWPPKARESHVLGFNQDGLGESEEFWTEIETQARCGRACGEFFPFGFGEGELPGDQSLDDHFSACFTSDALKEHQIILGSPTIHLTLAADKDRAQVIVRLCDLRPDGTSNLISIGLLNLRHRNSFEEKEALVPNEFYDVEIPLDQTSYRLPAGHRLRVSVSNSYWPYCWPEAEPFRLSLKRGELRLPILPKNAVQLTDFDPPIDYPTRDVQTLAPGNAKRVWREEDCKAVLEISGNHGRLEDVETGLVTESQITERWSVDTENPGSAAAEITWIRKLERGDWQTSTRLETSMVGDDKCFHVTQRLRAWEGDILVYDQSDASSIPR